MGVQKKILNPHKEFCKFGYEFLEKNIWKKSSKESYQET